MGYLLLAFVAFLGFVASLWCHVMGWLGIEPQYKDQVMLLHFGIFVVFAPLVYFFTKTMPASSEKRDNSAHVLAEIPEWVRKGLWLVAAYIGFNFFYTAELISQYPKHGAPFYLALRSASGHWMGFYGISALGFVGLFRLSRKNRATDIEPPKNNP